MSVTFLPTATIRANAVKFVERHKKVTDENAESQTFWNDFFQIFGRDRRALALFESQAKTIASKFDKEKIKHGYIDLFWPGVLLVEQKSKGKSLKDAMEQAKNYMLGLPDDKLPRYVIACDFDSFDMLDLYTQNTYSFTLKELPDKLHLFNFMIEKEIIEPDNDPVNQKATKIMGKIYESLMKSELPSEDMERFLTRMVFCMFADDTNIFEHGTLGRYLTKQQSTALGPMLAYLFQNLNEDNETNEDFPYINGDLFKDIIKMPHLTDETKELLLEADSYDWSKINPAIFGSMFQVIMNDKERRSAGAHYTTEENILRVIKPLFLNDLYDEYYNIHNNKQKLLKFHDKLADLTFFDPACGSGNFLTITYRELRRLEHKVIRALYKNKRFDISGLSKVKVQQFYGIDNNSFSTRIAEISLWMTDHLMNRELGDMYGEPFINIPLKGPANIICADALEIDWNTVLKSDKCSYVLGNPPFSGARQMSERQKTQTRKITKSSNFDYVANWFVKAVKYSKKSDIAFVSTNSLTQGEQVKLFNKLLKNKWEIFFAYTTFKWDSEASGKAQVSVVIIGLSKANRQKILYTLNNVHNKIQFMEIRSKYITPYLRETTNNIIVQQVTTPINGLPPMRMGSNPVDDKNYLFSKIEKQEFEKQEPMVKKFIRPYCNAKSFLHGVEIWVLALQNIMPNELKSMPNVMKKVAAVKKFREQNVSKTTRKYAEIPCEFYQTSIPKKPFLAVPQVSSEKREYVPMGFMKPPMVVSIGMYYIENANVSLFGLLESKMHLIWIRSFSGKLETRLRYAANRIYNTFPVPKDYSSLTPHAQKILDIRKKYSDSTLADLYDKNSMPTDLKKAHQKLDRQVEKLYRKEPFKDDDERLEFLLTKYEELVK